jgi:serine/threonine protein kinase/tetratricopeptide (TPR) repeat protein
LSTPSQAPQDPPTPGLRAQASGADYLRIAMGGWETEPPTEPLDPPTVLPFAVNAGDEIGRYRLIRPLGEGGFGMVWLAEQTTPILRQVALKIIKVGMNTEQVVARFNAERQVLALMDHPGIASVFDAGTTANERPYFVMEWVNGSPITTYCHDHRLTIPERLRLFVEVCRAIQHAHQKGILHRDLKPSNILITETDGKPTPKVIDFGISKAVDSLSTAGDLEQTRHDVLLGTPAYMSPEQAILGNPDLDTRTDLYSLGVILYELLTGRTPITPSQEDSSSLHDVLRSVRIDDVVRPSLLIQSQSPLPPYAPLTNPTELSRHLRGDLDWITLKALEKDRRNRYNSADALASDLLNHLQDLPITAGRPSLTGATLKFIRRNRLLVSSASAILLALLVGITIATYGLVREKTMRSLAESLRLHAEEQQTLAEKEKQIAKEQRDKAQASEKIAQTERQNAETTLNFLTQLLERTGEYVKQGKNPEALRLALDSLSAEISTFSHHPDTLEAITGRTALIYRFLRDEKKSLALVAEQVRLLEQSRPADDPDLLGARELYARTLYLQGLVEESYTQYDEVVRQREALLATRDGPRKLFLVRRNRADVWAGSGRREQALAEYEDIQSNATEEIRNHSSWPVFLRGYAQTLTDAKRWAEAEHIYSEALENLPLTDPEQQHAASTIHVNRSRLFLQLADLTSAVASLERGIQLQSQARGKTSPWLSEWFVELSRLYQLQHRHADAVKAARTGLETALSIGQTDRLYLCHRALGDQFEACGHYDAAADSYRASAELSRLQLPPPVSSWLDLAQSMRNIALCGRFGEASSLANRLAQVLPSWRADPERHEDFRTLQSIIAFTHIRSAESRNAPFNQSFLEIGQELAQPAIDRFTRNQRLSMHPAVQRALKLAEQPSTHPRSAVLHSADFLAFNQIFEDRWSGGDDSARLLELAAALRIAARHLDAVEVYHLTTTIEQPHLIIPHRRHTASLLAAETLQQIGRQTEAATLLAHLTARHRSHQDRITAPMILKQLNLISAPTSLPPSPAPAQKPSPPPPQLAKDAAPAPAPSALPTSNE